MNPSAVPDFDDLPKVEGQPQGCAWGVFDKDGKKDLFGTLNFLTPQIVAAAAGEIRDGISISLNWPLNGIKFPFFRSAPTHRIKSLPQMGDLLLGWDDELDFNTQFSSQWDSLCHVTSTSGITYNGAKVTQETLDAQSATTENPLPTIDHWHSRGGIVGRGVLIDFKSYFEETTGSAFDNLDGYSITVEEIETVAKHQKVEFKPGDILIVRTGYTELLEKPTPEDFAKMHQRTLAGVLGDEETARWVWNRRIAAVAGDAIAFESMPAINEDGTGDFGKNPALHNYFLTQFGMPIGELWDLKELASYAKKTGRYSFMLTSAPLNHPGLVASPPNAIAIF